MLFFAAGGCAALLCTLTIVVLVMGNTMLNRYTAEKSTETAVAGIRTATAQVVATKVAAATRIAAVTEAARSTEEALAFENLRSEAAVWSVVFSDTFDADPGIWYTGEDESDLGNGAWRIEKGQYLIHMDAKGSMSQWMWPTPIEDDEPLPSVGDFYLSAAIDFVEGSPGMDAGVIFRFNEDSDFYLFDLYADGRYAVYKHTAENWETIITETTAESFQSVEPNKLEVIGRGDEFILLLNGKKIASFRDSSFSQGWVGVLVGLSAAEDQGDWAFDNFMLRAPALPGKP